MKAYYVWIGIFEESEFEQYWDNEPYENAMKLWKKGQGAKPSENLKCGFCREMGLEELDEKDFWFSVRASLCKVRDLVDEFERKCKERGIVEGNVIWAVSVKDFLGLKPSDCRSMCYIGRIEV